MAFLKIGTCSWKYDSWRGIIYPQSGKINYLKEYSKIYNTVEIDQWFWSLHSLDKVILPKIRDVNSYALSVPEDFKFTIKVPNSITLTHFYQKSKNGELVENPHFLSTDIFNKFSEIIEPIHSKTGQLIFQFEYLNKLKMKSMSEFINLIGNFFDNVNSSLPISIEIRNPNYLKKEYFEFVKSQGISNVFLEGYYMPSIINSIRENLNLLEDSTILRLHGPDRKGIEKISKKEWNKIYINRNEELNLITDIIKLLINNEVNVYLNVNNHYEGSAPLTIEKIKSQLN